MKSSHFALIFICLSLSLPVRADIQPQTQGDVTFVSGGVGIVEHNALQAMRNNYNLHLLFALNTGEYTSDVNVNITDSKGNTLLETTATGPMLFASLKPGRYTVTAELAGEAIKRVAKVSSNRATSLTFTWSQ